MNPNNSTSAFKTAREIIDLGVTEMPSLLEGVFQETGLAGFVGTSDVGKSTWLREFSTAIVLGEDSFLGLTLNTRHKSVIYVSSEDDENSLSYAFNSTKEEGLLAHEGFNNLRFLFHTDNLIARLDAALTAQGADCVIIDAFGDVFPGAMNHYNEVRTFLQRFYQLANKHACLFIFLHHLGKRTESLAPSKNNILGSQGFEGKMRTVIELRSDPNSLGMRHLSILKGNYFDEEHKSMSYDLVFEDREFSATGNRTALTELSSSSSKTKDIWLPVLVEIYEQNPGISVSDAHKKMEKEGASVARATVGNWSKEIKREGD